MWGGLKDIERSQVTSRGSHYVESGYKKLERHVLAAGCGRGLLPGAVALSRRMLPQTYGPYEKKIP